MAPRRGGGSGSSSGGSGGPVCPGFLNDDYGRSAPIPYFVSYCLFFVLTLAALIYTCCVRKRSARQIGLLLAVLVLMSVGWALLILGTVLLECWVLPSRYDYYNFVITYEVFFFAGEWLLLFIQVWGVNRMLSKRLGSGQAVVKIATLAVTGIMAALTISYLAILCYNRRAVLSFVGGSAVNLTVLDAERKLAAAYWILYLLSVIAGGAISMALLMQIRSKSIAINDVMKRTVAFIFFMILWVIFELVTTIEDLNYSYFGEQTNTAMYWLNGLFQIFSYFAIISLCKLHFWRESATQTAYNTTGYGQPEYAHVQPPQQQYTYNGQPGQSHQYQQLPGHGVPAPVSGNGHMTQVN